MSLEVSLYQHITPDRLDAHILQGHGTPQSARGPSTEQSFCILPAEQQRSDITHQSLGQSRLQHGRVQVAAAFDQDRCDAELTETRPQHRQVHMATGFR
jgi:hypothetical protein